MVISGGKAYRLKSNAKAFAVADAPLRFRKELIRSGNWTNSGKTVAISPKDIDHWAKSFSTWRAAGAVTPLYVGNTHEGMTPEQKRGELISVSAEDCPAGGKSLFGVLEFSRPEYTALVTSDVSIYSPPEVTLGNGVTYQWPLEHVLITDSPVVLGLSKFEPITFTLSGGVAVESLLAIAKALELEIADGTAEADIVKAITDAIATLKEGKAADESAGDAGTEETPVEASQKKEDPVVMSLRRQVDELTAKNRKAELSALIRDGVPPAAVRKIEAAFCTPSAIALSRNGGDNFDAAVSALAELKGTVKLGEKSGAQAAPQPGESSLVKNAQARAAKNARK